MFTMKQLLAALPEIGLEGVYEAVEQAKLNKQLKYISDADEDGGAELIRQLGKIVRDEIKVVYLDMPDLQAERSKALGLLYDWLRSKPVVFLQGIHPARFAFQLALRVRRPRIIDQGGCGLCGPASILVPLAKQKPCAYVQLALALATAGKGTLNGLDLELGPGESQDWEARRVPEADYILLLALRKKAEILLAGSSSGGLDFDLDNQPTHATTPEQMVRLLTSAGYRNARSYTVSQHTYSKHRSEMQIATLTQHLRNCGQKLTDKNRELILMLVHPDIAKKAKYGSSLEAIFSGKPAWGPDPTVPRLADLHWILVKRLKVSMLSVEIKISTWRWSKTVLLPFDEFIHRYYGYVYAEP